MRTSTVKFRSVAGRRARVAWLLLLATPIVGAVAWSAATAPLASADGENGALELGPQYAVESPAPGEALAFPLAYGVDTVVNGRNAKKVVVAFSRGEDVATAEAVNDSRVSYDGARTFHEYVSHSESANVGRLPDGTLISLAFIPSWVDERHQSVLVNSSLSSDLGKSWQKQSGLFTPGVAFSPKFNRGLRVNAGAMVLADGTVVVPAYTQFESDAFNRTILLESRNRGRSWTQRGTIVAPTKTQGTNEVGLSRTVDGRLTAVLRTDGGSRRLLQVWSSDEGKTWTTPQTLQVQGTASAEGVDPVMLLQPNGVLLLGYGRPDNRVLASYDGNGQLWQDERVAFANAPESSGPGRFHGSSGYTSLVSLDANRSLLVGDSCANTWGCKEYDQLARIWARQVEAVTPGTGKIDLASKVASGAVTLSGRFAPPDARFPEMRPQGAVDGSSAPRAAAFLSAATPQLVIKLEREYLLTRLGLMLGAGQANDANVQLSLDGVNWSQPVVSARRRTDWSLRYQNISPQRARFVRVAAPAGGTLRAVTEIELYSDELSFENDPVFAPPRGFTDVQNARVTNVGLGGFNSARALYFLDHSTTSQAQATRPEPPRAQQRAGFRLAIGEWQTPVVMSVNGTDAQNQNVIAWRLALASANNPRRTIVRVNDGQKWSEIGTLQAPLELNKWLEVSLRADENGATLTVENQAFSTTTRYQTAARLNGITFASGGVADYGSEFWVDDLQVGDR